MAPEECGQWWRKTKGEKKNAGWKGRRCSLKELDAWGRKPSLTWGLGSSPPSSHKLQGTPQAGGGKGHRRAGMHILHGGLGVRSTNAGRLRRAGRGATTQAGSRDRRVAAGAAAFIEGAV
eukprot:GGOE01030116.1.p3 GENE.GGOE01030116.1~~GGOE01030116.1.p3  ORF type:complete len:120 (+),score=7.01 GGOE01030116.1:246-605(+)